MRSAWATASAAIFFLAETETYLQIEVVARLWGGFQRWLATGNDEQRHEELPKSSKGTAPPAEPENPDDDDDIWLSASTARPAIGAPRPTTPSEGQTEGVRRQHHHDPQTLATAHRLYLLTLVQRLLLTRPSFTDPLYELLVHIDHLVALIHRLHGIWASVDLEADAGVVDAFVDLEREEVDIKGEIKAVEEKVRKGVQHVVGVLRTLEGGPFMGDEPDGDGVVEGIYEDGAALGLRERGQYVPRRVGGLDRLLMKLDFGTWVDSGRRPDSDGDEAL